MTAELSYYCKNCGHKHNEETEGQWDNLKEDFTCPECNNPKQNYEVDLWYQV